MKEQEKITCNICKKTMRLGAFKKHLFIKHNIDLLDYYINFYNLSIAPKCKYCDNSVTANSRGFNEICNNPECYDKLKYDRMSKAQIKKWAKSGYKDERRIAQSGIAKKMWESQEYRDKMDAALKSNKSKRSASMTKKWEDKNFRELQRKSHEHWYNSEEGKKFYSNAAKKVWDNYNKLSETEKMNTNIYKKSQVRVFNRWLNYYESEEYYKKELIKLIKKPLIDFLILLKRIAYVKNDYKRVIANRKPISDETKQKIGEASIKMWKNPESRSKLIASRKEMWTRPEFREKQLMNNHSWNSMTPRTQISIEKWIKSIYPGTILRNKSISVEYPKQMDIYIPDKNFAIEYDHLVSHSIGVKGVYKYQEVPPDYHLYKTINCLKRGILLFHIWSNEWESKQDIWKSMIKNKLNLTDNRIYARKCNVKIVNGGDANIFFTKNHLQGFLASTVYLGLYYNNKLISCISFSKTSNRFNKNYEWELTRYSSALNTIVIGGFNKLFKYFIKNYNPNSIISYANRRWSNGDIYRKSGFKELNPSGIVFYWWNKSVDPIKNNEPWKLYHRRYLWFYPKSDINLTIEQNAMLNGWRKIYDCGNLVFVWDKLNPDKQY